MFFPDQKKSFTQFVSEFRVNLENKFGSLADITNTETLKGLNLSTGLEWIGLHTKGIVNSGPIVNFVYYMTYKDNKPIVLLINIFDKTISVEDKSFQKVLSTLKIK